jgi:hypothetical protein
MVTVRFMRQDGVVQDAVCEAGTTLLLGRDVVCDVRLDGRKVSRRHLRIESLTYVRGSERYTN